MKNIIELKAVNLDKLSIGEYSQFIERVVNLIVKATPEKLFLEDELLPKLQEKLVLLTEVIGQSYASQETKQLNDLDKERNKLSVFLLSSFRLEKNSIEEDRKKAATELHNVSKNYIGLQTFPMRQKTQFINGMVNDLYKAENKRHIVTLGLLKTLDLLDEKNKEYQKLSEGRSESQLANKVVSFKKVKKETNELYRRLAKFAFAGNLLHESAESATFVNMLNKLITETMTANKQRLAQALVSKNGTAKQEPKTPISENVM